MQPLISEISEVIIKHNYLYGYRISLTFCHHHAYLVWHQDFHGFKWSWAILMLKTSICNSKGTWLLIWVNQFKLFNCFILLYYFINICTSISASYYRNHVKFVNKIQYCWVQSEGLFTNILHILGDIPMYCTNTINCVFLNII